VNDTTQIYDFNPGFGPAVNSADSGNGFGTRVFWTAVIPDSDFRIHLGAGTGELNVSNLAVISYYSPTGFAGNISLGPNWQTAGIDATVSFDVVWNGPVTRRVNVTDATDGFAGTFNEVNNNNVTVAWSGSNALGFSFISNVGDLTTSNALAPGNFFAQLAQEHNGTFFPGGSSPSRPDSLPVHALLDRVFAALALPSNSAVSLPVSTGSGQGDFVDHSAERPPAASDPTETTATTAQPARDRVLDYGSGADLANFIPDLGQPDSDSLFR
jgi:hypothetical protein